MQTPQERAAESERRDALAKAFIDALLTGAAGLEVKPISTALGLSGGFTIRLARDKAPDTEAV